VRQDLPLRSSRAQSRDVAQRVSTQPVLGLAGGQTRGLDTNGFRSTAVAFAALLALAGCGAREPLRPAAGETLPPKPAMAAKAPTVDELLTPPTDARPDRSDELLKRSEERPDDRFNLPPPG
jgi:hypothetical protein